jgi:hypothetical protein
MHYRREHISSVRFKGVLACPGVGAPRFVIVLSIEPLISVSPCTTKQSTASVWPSRVCSHVQVSLLHTLIVLLNELLINLSPYTTKALTA